MLHSLTLCQHAVKLESPCLQLHLAWLVVWHSADCNRFRCVTRDLDLLSHQIAHSGHDQPLALALHVAVASAVLAESPMKEYSLQLMVHQIGQPGCD